MPVGVCACFFFFYNLLFQGPEGPRHVGLCTLFDHFVDTSMDAHGRPWTCPRTSTGVVVDVRGRPRTSVNVRERSWACPRTSTGVHGRPRTTSMGIFVDTSMDRSKNVRGHVRGQRPWTCPLFVCGRRRTSMDPSMDMSVDLSTDMSMDKSTACPRTCPRTRAMDVVGGRVRVRKFLESIGVH